MFYQTIEARMLIIKRKGIAFVILKQPKSSNNTETLQTVWSDWSEQVVGRSSLFSRVVG